MRPAASPKGAGFVPYPALFLVVIFAARRDCLPGGGDLAHALAVRLPRQVFRLQKQANPDLHPWSPLPPLLRLFLISVSLAAASSGCDRFVRLAIRCR